MTDHESNNNCHKSSHHHNRNSAECTRWPMYTLVGFVSFVCYVNGFSGDFVHDDIPAVTLNKDVLAVNPIAHIFLNDFWGTPMADVNSHKSYRPLTTLTFR
ncbi:protein O-mannosyl-transferase TMTC4-like [Chrysoperla carnea]|uniref:protein O-mannosyl-transferase TMTC4-like n=1 Tax=Chrysoperla carnea TaxID=189513 RepID=UPI001D08CD6A|nr:protein O-mannosyl-transferase TMTC4-like [Chrysoperla carnea]